MNRITKIFMETFCN